MTEPHDRPTAAELVAAVREFLADEVMPALEGRKRFHTRVAVNVLGTVERELALGPGQAARHVAALDAVGVVDEAELAAGIRSGRFDDRLDEVALVVRETVRDKLAVANPAYLEGPRP
jgi:hypothetical protein